MGVVAILGNGGDRLSGWRSVAATCVAT